MSVNFNKKIILITGHRRENFGKPMQDTCTAFKTLAFKYPEVQFVYPVHLNPNVQEIVKPMLSDIKNFFLICSVISRLLFFSYFYNLKYIRLQIKNLNFIFF